MIYSIWKAFLVYWRVVCFLRCLECKRACSTTAPFPGCFRFMFIWKNNIKKWHAYYISYFFFNFFCIFIKFVNVHPPFRTKKKLFVRDILQVGLLSRIPLSSFVPVIIIKWRNIKGPFPHSRSTRGQMPRLHHGKYSLSPGYSRYDQVAGTSVLTHLSPPADATCRRAHADQGRSVPSVCVFVCLYVCLSGF